MNRTTVKRGIGAVILALIAAALLAFLLKDKAAQRQEVVEIALPGTGESSETSNQTTKLPTLTTDNSEGGSVIANAGSGSGNEAPVNISVNSASGSSLNTAAGTGTSGSTTGSNNTDGTIIASAAAVGTAAAGAATSATGTAAKSVDFSVKPKAATKASSEFLDLDLVNNGTSNSPAATPSNANNAVAANTATSVSTQSAAVPKAAVNTDQGIVIASTAPKSSGSSANVVQPRLIGEKRAAPVKSASTAKVVSKKVPAKAGTESTPNTASQAKQAKNGYAIQLLATSNQTRANNLKNVMAGEGYPAYVTKTKQNGKTLFRVRIGQYAVKSAALKAQSQMKRRYKKNTNVNRSAVVAR